MEKSAAPKPASTRKVLPNKKLLVLASDHSVAYLSQQCLEQFASGPVMVCTCLEEAERLLAEIDIYMVFAQPSAKGPHTWNARSLGRVIGDRPVILIENQSITKDLEWATNNLSAESIDVRTIDKKHFNMAIKRVLAKTRHRKKLEEKIRYKTECMAHLSHEIRGPLNGIMGIAALLKETNLSEEQTQLVSTLHETGNHLVTLVSEILELSRFEAGQIALKNATTKSRKLFADTIATYASAAQTKGISLACDVASQCPSLIYIDPMRFRQVLSNLISNAIKFTDKGSVKVSVTFDESQNQLKCQVTDTGIGISKSALKRIFEPFIQSGRNLAAESCGSGLGLSISQKLVHLMDGELRVTSQPGKGTSFWFTCHTESQDHLLKQQPTEASTANTSVEQAAVATKISHPIGVPQQKTYPTVPSEAGTKAAGTEPNGRTKEPRSAGDHTTFQTLIVDDDDLNRKVAVAMIHMLGGDAVSAKNGSEALGQLKSQKFHLVLLDYKMPEMDGRELAKAIREFDEDIPLVCITADARSECRDACLAAGMDAVITKPFTQEDLQVVLEKHTPHRNQITIT